METTHSLCNLGFIFDDGMMTWQYAVWPGPNSRSRSRSRMFKSCKMASFNVYLPHWYACNQKTDIGELQYSKTISKF